MRIGTARDAADLFEPIFLSAATERVAVLHLGADRRVIELDESEAQQRASARLPVRAILAAAMARGACGIVVAHNHPSGNPGPSAADIAATRCLAETGAALGIRLHDHLIFAGPRVRSLRGLGLL